MWRKVDREGTWRSMWRQWLEESLLCECCSEISLKIWGIFTFSKYYCIWTYCECHQLLSSHCCVHSSFCLINQHLCLIDVRFVLVIFLLRYKENQSESNTVAQNRGLKARCMHWWEFTTALDLYLVRKQSHVSHDDRSKWRRNTFTK